MNNTPPGRIVADAAMLAGKPVARGTRISVEFVIGLLAEGWTAARILENSLQLSSEDIKACLGYAHDLLAGEKVFPSAA
jgi:uncharacterized protein (DUF433 family)